MKSIRPELHEVSGPLKDFWEKLLGAEGHAWLDAFKRFLRKENPWSRVAETVSIQEAVLDLPVEYYVDLDAPPMIPELFNVKLVEHRKGGKRVRVERRGDDLFLDGKKIVLFLSDVQRGGKSIQRDRILRKQLKKMAVLNANLLDFLIKYPELTPESWKRDENGNIRYICFRGTIYRNSGDFLFVRYLFWRADTWHWDYCWLDDASGVQYPAALLAD